MRAPFFMGMFALITLVLACATVGRGLGMKLAEAFYMSVLILMVSLTYLWRRKRG